MTPSVARAAAKYFMDEDMPDPACAIWEIPLSTTAAIREGLKESTALGAELIGDGTVEADAEILAMVVDCLQKAGLKDFQISVGHAEFYRGLVAAAGIDEDAEES